MKIISILILAVAMLTSCDSIQKKEELRVGISADYPPFDMMIDGEVVGFDADLAKIIAEKMNKELVIKEIDFNSLMPALDSGAIDLVISNVSRTEERAKNYDFSIPYYKTEAFLITKYKDKKRLKDFRMAKIGAQAGSIFETQLTELGYQTKPLARLAMMVEDLKTGNVDAILIDGPQVESIIDNYPDFTFIPATEIKDGGISVALKKGSNLTEKVDVIITETLKDGSLEAINQKWLVDFESAVAGEKIMGVEVRYFKVIAKGISLTLEFSLISTICGFLIATILTVLSGTSKLFKYVSNLYVSILRGTPLILQLSIIYFALPMILEVKISVFTAGIVAFSINSAAYMFEHLKAGINGVDKGQIEAANAIGMTKYQTMKLIVIPQALRNIVPSLINEAINMVKESSIISVLGAQDIMRKAQLISSETYDYLTPLIIAGIYYYIIINVMNIILVIINKKVAR